MYSTEIVESLLRFQISPLSFDRFLLFRENRGEEGKDRMGLGGNERGMATAAAGLNEGIERNSANFRRDKQTAELEVWNHKSLLISVRGRNRSKKKNADPPYRSGPKT